VYRGPVGYAAEIKIEYLLLVRLSQEFSAEIEECFKKGVSADHAMVVAYCLVGLELIASECLNNLPGDLVDRREVIKWELGCRSGETTLGEFVRMCQPTI